MVASLLRASDIPETGPSSFRDLLAALPLGDVSRVLDVGAGGFVGETTTRFLVELFPDAAITALELNADRAAALNERFGDAIEVIEGDVREFEPEQPFDLVVVDLDSGLIPMIFEDLLDGVVARLTRPGGVAVTLLMTNHERAFHGPKAFPPANEQFHRDFMERAFGALTITEQLIADHFEENPRFGAAGLVEKWRNDPANFIGWLALRRSDSDPLTAQELELRTRVRPLNALAREGAASALDMVCDTSSCGPDCADLLARWADWARTRFEGTVDPHDVDSGLASALGERAGGRPIVAPARALALLETPDDMAAYLKRIGDKSRNMVRKAHRSGLVYRAFDRNDYLDDLFEVNTSKSERQGREMSPAYREPLKPARPHDGCPLHSVTWLGAFRDDRLRAYVRLVGLGELGVVDAFLGHGDDLHYGVMNGLVHHMVEHVLDAGHIKAIDYLTLHSSTDTLDGFKRRVGFEERAVLLAVVA